MDPRIIVRKREKAVILVGKLEVSITQLTSQIPPPKDFLRETHFMARPKTRTYNLEL